MGNVKVLLLTGKVAVDCHNRHSTLLRLAEVYGPVELVRLVECFYRCRERGQMDELENLLWQGNQLKSESTVGA